MRTFARHGSLAERSMKRATVPAASEALHRNIGPDVSPRPDWVATPLKGARKVVIARLTFRPNASRRTGRNGVEPVDHVGSIAARRPPLGRIGLACRLC